MTTPDPTMTTAVSETDDHPTTLEVARVDYTIETETERIERPDGTVQAKPRDYPLIHLFGYDEDDSYQHLPVKGFEPYFYVPYEEVSDDPPEEIRRFEVYDETGNEYRSVRGERVAKAVVRLPGDIYDAKQPYSQTWEHDVDFATRFIVDQDITTGVQAPTVEGPVTTEQVSPCQVNADWRVHYMDIEVNDRGGFPENGDEPILSISAYDTELDTYIVWLQTDTGHDAADASPTFPAESSLHDAAVEMRTFETEVAMLQNYIAFVSGSKPSIITGWNLDDFDIPYLFDRCETLTEETDETVYYQAMSPLKSASHNDYYGPRIKGVVILDLLKAFKRQTRTDWDSYRLDAVAEGILGVAKETFVGKIGDLWEDDPARLVDYNLRDVELLVELDRRQDIIAFVREVKSFVGCQLDDAIIESTCCDRYLLNHLHGDRVLPGQSSAESEEFSGGAVHDAVTGIFEMVPTLDLKSLYPMSMLTLNASPETKVDPAEFDGPMRKSPNGIYFRTDQEAITRDVIENLLEEREAKKAERDEYDPESEAYAIRDRQQTAIKVIMNALYGVMSWTRFRLYDVDVGSAVTATGRGVLEFTTETVEELGYNVYYGDTDSVLLDVGATVDTPVEEVVETGYEIEAAINAAYDEYAREVLQADSHRFEIEFEKLYKRFFQAGSKKRYSGHTIWEDGHRVDSVSITGFQYKRSDSSKLTKRVQQETLERIVHGESPESVAAYLSEQVEAFNRRAVPLGEIGIPKGIGSQLHDYDSDTHASRGAKYGNLFVGTSFASGSKPKRYYLESVHPSFYDRMESEVGLDASRDAMFEEFQQEPWVIGVDQPEELPPEFALDWDRMQQKTLQGPIEGIMESIGIDWEYIVTGDSQSDLEAWL